MNDNSVRQESSHFEIKGFIVSLWNLTVSYEDVLEVDIPKPKSEEGSDSDDGHSSRKTETYKDKHDRIGIMILNIELHRFQSLLHLGLDLHALGSPVTVNFLDVVDQRHGEIGMYDHNDPGQEDLVTDSSVPFRYEIAVLTKGFKVAGQVGIADEERHKGFEGNAAYIGLQKEGNQHSSAEISH